MYKLLVVLIVSLILARVTNSLHEINEGHVGVYWRFGALLNRVSEPGWNVAMPLVDRISQVQTTVQTDRVENIPCGTSSGVMLWFSAIEVVNRLRADAVIDTIRKYGPDYDKIWILDKIHHEINQFCSKHTLHEVYISKFDMLDESLAEALQEGCNKYAPGIEIIATRVTKPTIPYDVREQYIELELQRAKLNVASAHQKVVEVESETTRKISVIRAQAAANVSAIEGARDLVARRIEANCSQVADAVHLAHERTLADADHYTRTREAEANSVLLTSAYARKKQLEELSRVPKRYFVERGEDVLEGWGRAVQGGGAGNPKVV